MTTEEINQIVENLKLHGEEKVIDDAFQLFIDNQVTLSEFEIILSKLDYKLPPEFYEMSKDYQKQFHQHKFRRVEFTPNGPRYMEYEIYNKAYFRELIEGSKKNRHITEALMQYVHELDQLPLYIIAMQHIKLKNLKYAVQHENWMSYSERTGRKTLYDFYIGITGLVNTKEKAELVEQFATFMAKDTGFNLDMNLEFVKFAFSIEYILSALNPKVANTIKMKFLVYKPEYIDDNEYNKSLENGRTLINKHKQIFKPKAVQNLVAYYSKHRDILDSFGDDGYRAIYYSIIEEVL